MAVITLKEIIVAARVFKRGKREFESIGIDIMHFAPGIEIESIKDGLLLASMVLKKTKKTITPIID